MFTIRTRERQHEWIARWSWSLLLIVLGSCAGILDPGIPSESPGVLLTGLPGACLTNFTDFSQCLAWSSDGLTLFVVQARQADTVLVAVDVAAASSVSPNGAYRVVGRVGLLLNIATSQDPRTIFFTRRAAAEAGGFEVLRMSLADGATSRIAGAAAPDLIATPDGTGLAYHAFRAPLTLDTVALVDVASGVRRATTVGVAALLRSISPDGRDVALKALVGDSAVIWHSSTGVRETPRDGTGSGAAPRAGDLQWTPGGFSTLIGSASGGFTETSVATGVAISYAPRQASLRGSVAWSPASSRVFIADGTGKCYSGNDCGNATFHSDLVVTSPAGVRSIGSVNARSSGINFRAFYPSPDGRWLAYLAETGRLYLLPTGF